jgi:hypothetical protein
MNADQIANLVAIVMPKNSSALINYGTKDAIAITMHLNHQLHGQFYPYAHRFYLYATPTSLNEDFNPFTQSKNISILELLELLNDNDYKLVVQNYITHNLGSKLGNLLNFKYVQKNTETGQSTVTKITISDINKEKLINSLPTSLQEQINKQYSEDQTKWRKLNYEALISLAETIERKQLVVSATAFALIEHEIFYYLREKERKIYNELWVNNFVKLWKIFEQKDKIRLIDRLDNRQWAEILAVKPTNFDVIAKYISKGRQKFLKEEIDYIIERGLNYAEANKALRSLL